MTARVFVACPPDGQDAEFQLVLEHSLRRHSSIPVEITWMALSNDPSSPFYAPAWDTSSWTTPFTPFRFIVPALCGNEGRAIYSDVDVLFRADIAELWNMPFEDGKCIIARSYRRLCVSLIDCDRAASHFPTIKEARKGVKGTKWHDHWKQVREGVVQCFPKDQRWNCIDGDGSAIDDTIKAIHYSDLATQPHLLRARKRMKARGKGHWSNVEALAHPRRDLVSLFNKELMLAGEDVSKYEKDTFKEMPKTKDLSDYKGGHRGSWSCEPGGISTLLAERSTKEGQWG